MKQILTLIAVLLSTTAFAQRTTKMDLDLLSLTQSQNMGQTRAKALNIDKSSLFANMLQNAERLNVTPKSVKVAGVLSEGAAVPESELAALGITIEDVTLNIVDMVVPTDKLIELDQLSAFRSLSKQKGSMLMNKKSHEVEHVDVLQDQARATQEGLPQTYTGEGVIVGVFDCGIDFNHANFRDPETKQTRIKEAIYFPNCTADNDENIYDLDGKPVSAQDVMRIYTQASDIDTLTTDYKGTSHGTHTSSTTAGSYNGDYLDQNGKVTYTGQRGAAYKADLILAGASISLVPDQFLRLSLTEMDKYATSENKPLVINQSLGSRAEWMDGKTDLALFYKELTNNGNKPGRVICVSAGNDGDSNFCIYKQLDASNDYTLRTFLPKSWSDYKMNEVKFYNSNSAELEISVAIIDTITNQTKEVLTAETLVAKGLLTSGYAENHDNRYFANLKYAFLDYDLEQKHVPALIVKSKDHQPCKVRMFNIYPLELPKFYDYGRQGYTASDNKSSINSRACTDAVLSVGAWTAQRVYNCYDGTSHEGGYGYDCTMNEIAKFSSYIESDDNGIARPDFVAPGVTILSGVNAYDMALYENPVNNGFAGIAKEEYGRKDGKQSLLGYKDGTSMSCPNATGIVALWLQANPNLTVNQIREVIKATADKDEFTAAAPARFGAGKINALAGLKYILKNYPSAIQDVVNGEPKGLDEPAISKIIKNGRVVIVKNGVEYNAAGARLK